MARHAAERRAFGRRSTCIRGIVRIPGRRPVHCIIRNISEAGALLDFGQKPRVPFMFDLTIDGFRGTFPCEVRHDGSTAVGVRFINCSVKPIVESLGRESASGGEHLHSPPASLPTEKAKPAARFDALAFRAKRNAA